jgi:hypothetical protein
MYYYYYCCCYGTFVYFYRFLVPYVISHYFQYSFQTLFVLREERYVRDIYIYIYMCVCVCVCVFICDKKVEADSNILQFLNFK